MPGKSLQEHNARWVFCGKERRNLCPATGVNTRYGHVSCYVWNKAGYVKENVRMGLLDDEQNIVERGLMLIDLLIINNLCFVKKLTEARWRIR